MRRVSPPCGFPAPSLAVEFSIHPHQICSKQDLNRISRTVTGIRLFPDLFDIFLQPQAGHLLGCRELCLSIIGLSSESPQRAHRLHKLFCQPGGQYTPEISWNSTAHRAFTTQRPEMYKRSGVRSLVSPGRCAALSNLRPGAVVICSLLRHSPS